MKHFRKFGSFILIAFILIALGSIGSFAIDGTLNLETTEYEYQIEYVQEESFSVTIPAMTSYASNTTTTVSVYGSGNLAPNKSITVFIRNGKNGARLTNTNSSKGVGCTIESNYNVQLGNHDNDVLVGYIQGGLGYKEFNTTLTFKYTPDDNLPVGKYTGTVTFVSSIAVSTE